MDMTMTSVAPVRVKFHALEPESPDVRELSDFEIDGIFGGCRICNTLRSLSNGVVAVGSGIALGGFVNPGFALAGGATIFVGAVGLFVSERLESFATGRKLDI